jgi:hypothetical protein
MLGEGLMTHAPRCVVQGSAFPRFSDKLRASDVGDIIAAKRKPGALGSLQEHHEERERDQREEVGS